MPISDFMRGSGVRIKRGLKGRLYHGTGVIDVVRAARVGIDSHLWGALKILVDELGIWIEINSIDTGKHSELSRHYRGLATDFWRVGMAHMIGDRDVPPIASSTNLTARTVCTYLSDWGWKHREYGRWPSVLLGPAHSRFNETDSPHLTHIHLSLFR